MSKCQSCPIAGGCIAERPGYSFACKFADGTESEKLWLVNRSAQLEGKPPQEYPSIVTQAGNLAKAVGRFVASGLKRVDEETYQERLAICRTCDQYDAAQKRCRLCGCKTTAKLRMASESCPLLEPKWSAVTSPSSDGDFALEQGGRSSAG
jgi:hypothetical protein